MGLQVHDGKLSVDEVIERLRATAPAGMLAGVDQFKRCPKSKQIELLALQLQHLCAAMANADALLEHIHQRVCYVDDDEDEQELIN